MIGKRVRIIKGEEDLPPHLIGATGVIRRSNPMGFVMRLDNAPRPDGINIVFVHADEIEVIE